MHGNASVAFTTEKMKMNNRRYIRPRDWQKAGSGMNKTEARYAEQLELLKKAGEILDWQYEAVKFKLAPNTYYTPDFMVVKQDMIIFVEVKGYLREDANVKFKAVADKFPWFKWEMIRWKNKATGFETIKEF